MKINSQIVEDFFQDQIHEWPQAHNNYSFLSKVLERSLMVDGVQVKLQYNPARIFSSSAKVDNDSIRERPCFLCPAIRPEKQKSIDFVTHQGNEYSLLVNPFPIFPKHFTIPSKEHTEQMIDARFEDMLDIVDALPEYVIFYNGPHCGASAPDHFHFQAGTRGFLPIENHTDKIEHIILSDTAELKVNLFTAFFKGTVQIISSSRKLLIETFYQSLKVLKRFKDESERVPMFNILLKKDGDVYDLLVINRKAHRPDCYYQTGTSRMLISPGAVDMGGVMVLPIKEDFDRITEDDVKKVLSDVCFDNSLIEKCITESRSFLTRDQQTLEVGILEDTLITIDFKGDYYNNYLKCEDREIFRFRNGKIDWNGHNYEMLNLMPRNPLTDSFVVENVKIGSDFHWERSQNQRFRGIIRIVAGEDRLTLVNIIGIEDYLLGVISSEMNPDASIEFLKAHAIISRSWVLSMLMKKKNPCLPSESSETGPCQQSEEQIKWYGQEQHHNFDVCADDHCQRYQGLPDTVPEKLRFVIDDTWGEVLYYQGHLCDARFSKCCGGVTERFSTCWEDLDKDYLRPVRDSQSALLSTDQNLPILTSEEAFEKWVLSMPDSFCRVSSSSEDNILSRILKNYDQETPDFYRWKVEYQPSELNRLVKEKSGIDFGDILDILPIERGSSGRLVKIKIVGTKKTLVIGKELEIRRILSDTHLKSSAFIVKKENGKFVFYGAGWGHGVGLCQIGAAMMGEKGFSCMEILSHYYPGTILKKIY